MLMTVKVDELRTLPTLLTQLSYPAHDPNYAILVSDAMVALGLEALELHDAQHLKLIGKGFRNIVLVGLLRGERVAVKVRRSDYAIKSAWREAQMLSLANKTGVGPRLLGYEGPILVMSLAEGPDISKWLFDMQPPEGDVKKTLLEVAMQCHRLDFAGIDHKELSDLSKHVIITMSGPVLIDFGSASLSLRPKNLTSLFNYLYSKQLEPLRQRLGLKTVSRESLRRYKEERSRESLNTILEEAGLL